LSKLPRLVHITQSKSIGGVAEVVCAELACLTGATAEWPSLRTDSASSRWALLLHKALYGAGVDDELAAADPWEALCEYGRAEGARLAPAVAGADALILHDPLGLVLAPTLRPHVGTILWRCHVGDDVQRSDARRAMEGLRPYLDFVDVAAFLRAPYVWPDLDPERVIVVPPGIAPGSSKNQELRLPTTAAAAPLLTRGELPPSLLSNGREASSNSPVLDDVGTGFIDDPARPIVLQVSRWDPLKGHRGVLAGFRAVAELHTHAELVLLGPHIDPARNYPENTAVLKQLLADRRALPEPIQRRVHVWSFRACSPHDEAVAVNVLQRAATVVTQNSLREAFGLTATEAMWKKAAVLVSGVGGLGEQVTDDVTGVVAPDTSGGESWSAQLSYALAHPSERTRWGACAHERVAQRYLAEVTLRRQIEALGWSDMVAAR
jgi:trehalose synthase